MRIYFNTSALNRPFDDLSSERVRVEAEAVASLFATERVACWLSCVPQERISGSRTGSPRVRVSLNNMVFEDLTRCIWLALRQRKRQYW